jgi:hypothetical protein
LLDPDSGAACSEPHCRYFGTDERHAIEVRSASFRRLRGISCVAVIADEAAFWHSDESANPDTEILNAVRPALATTGGPLIVISSLYARRS